MCLSGPPCSNSSTSSSTRKRCAACRWERKRGEKKKWKSTFDIKYEGSHTHQCRLMTVLQHLNECLRVSSDAAGHLSSLDIDLYINCANTTENNRIIMGCGLVSPGQNTRSVIGASVPSAARCSLHCEADKCKDDTRRCVLI